MRETGAPILTDVQRRAVASLESSLEHIARLPSVIARLASLDPDAPGAIDQIVALNRFDPPPALRLPGLMNATANGRKIDATPDAIVRAGSHNPAQTILALSAIEMFVPASVSVILSSHRECDGACARARPAGVRNEARGQSVHRRHKRRATLLHGYDGMRAGLQIACRRQIETK